MKTFALIMAGGAGERMRNSLGAVPKPLVAIRGVPLIERNLIALLNAGWRDIAVSTPAAAPEIRAFLASRGMDLARSFQAEVLILEETMPLGNVGAAGQLRLTADTVLLVYADNLTTLSTQDLVGEHRRSGAALTLATHRQPFAIPFGELRVADGRVLDYSEKPTHYVQISSGLAVLGSDALGAIPSDRPTGLSNLALTLIEQGRDVRAFSHAAPWIDVNDGAAVGRAEAMVGSVQEFECWAPRPDRSVIHVLLKSPNGILLETPTDVASGSSTGWSIPHSVIADAMPMDNGAASMLLATIGIAHSTPHFVSRFDDVDTASRLVLRHHLYIVEFGQDVASDLQIPGTAWKSIEDIDPARASRVLIRALVALRLDAGLKYEDK